MDVYYLCLPVFVFLLKRKNKKTENSNNIYATVVSFCSFEIKFEQKLPVNPYLKRRIHYEKRLIKMDSSLALLILFFIKKFDHFLPELLHKRARLWNKGSSYSCGILPYIKRSSQIRFWVQE